MKGQNIVVSADPKGVFMEGIISGTPKPGTMMQIQAGTLPVNGRFTYEAVSRVDGSKGPVFVLREDHLQGKLATDAYVSGTRGFLYAPAMGEDLNVLMRYEPGTGTLGAETVGDMLEIDGTTGKVQAATAAGAGVSAPFQLLEHLGVALAADALVWVKFMGNAA